MPKPMTENSYAKISNVLRYATKHVAEETMVDAAAELRGNVTDDIVDVSVSCDGTWQRRGYSSLNGESRTLHI